MKVFQNLFSKNVSIFYQYNRFIEFEKTKALLREYIVKKINESFINIGKHLNFTATIELNGMSNSREINEVLLNLNKGLISFSDVNSYFS